MATTNRQRVEEALDILRDALEDYFQKTLDTKLGSGTWHLAVAGADKFNTGTDHVDLTRLLDIFHTYRNDVFRPVMGQSVVNFMHEAQLIRNKWAHQEAFDTRDTLRALDTIDRILEVAGTPDEVMRIATSYQQLRQSEVTERARSETRKVTQQIKSQGSDALIPWSDVITPHEDVRTGNLKEAEFAADLWQVHQGNAGPEYGDPTAFFRRTYLTEGLSSLLETSYRRLSGQGGDPVIELQTNFGGGKTHSMIALYHLASCESLAELPGLDSLIKELGTAEKLCVQRAVLVGTKLSANQARAKSDGTIVRTLWGELAWQLAGPDGYALVADSDQSGHAPGADVLQQVFDLAGDSLILIDEWVAFVRQLYGGADRDAIAGSFEANLTFAQNLTEAVTNTPGVLLAASLPSSDVEVGGEGGREALKILQHTFSRVKASWRPASTNESFEIVRRRLFDDVVDTRKRDATIQLFLKQYRDGQSQFPTKVHEADYRKRMEAAYPFHPETFDQLFEVWGTLDTFQRTRGVLRLMANVVFVLWDRKDASPLIMPANLPLDYMSVATEMGSYLPDSWSSVIAHDIDGDSAVSLMLDRENPNFDRMSAARRVARAIFLGSAPLKSIEGENRGINSRSILLGVAQPGESLAIFGDALRQMTTRSTYLYSEHDNYWFSTQPSVTQVAQERKAQLKDDDVDHELEQWLKKDQGKRGIFDRVHIAPASSGDVADTPEVSLVILGPGMAHVRRQLGGDGSERSAAVKGASSILESRGDGRRQHRNSVLFLAPDNGDLSGLRDAMKDWMVWKGIVESKEALTLNTQQIRQAETRRDDAAKTVESRIRETWSWLLSPHQEATPGAEIVWEQVQVKSGGSDESLAVLAGRKAIGDEKVVSLLAPLMLRQQIDSIPTFKDGWTHIRFGDLQNWYADYLYLYRLKDPVVLEETMRAMQGVLMWDDYFGIADGYDETSGRYIGLKWGHKEALLMQLTKSTLLVNPELAKRQRTLEEDEERRRVTGGAGDGTGDSGDGRGPGPIQPPIQPPIDPDSPVEVPLPKRYFGSVTINPQTMASSVS
ncbi:MAG: DUF499 domain-containing protein, partial [Thermomicrobiales bacterium]|nr:DUF499 domain-containing protein [Thermomicrobiales bacterium]